MSALLGSLRGPAPAAATLADVASHAGTLFDEPEETSVPPEPAPAPPVVITADAHPDLDDFRSRLQAIRDRAVNAGLLNRVEMPLAPQDEEPELDEAEVPFAMPVEVAPHVWSAFEPYGHSAAERLGSFVAWAQSHLGESEVFIIDDQGNVLFGQSPHRGLVLSTVMAWVATSRMSAVFAFDRAPLLRQQMTTGPHLLAVPCPTRLGLIHLAITCSQPLADEHVPDLRQALIQAMEAAA